MTLISIDLKISAAVETDWDSQLHSLLFNDSDGLKKRNLWEALRDIY